MMNKLYVYILLSSTICGFSWGQSLTKNYVIQTNPSVAVDSDQELINLADDLKRSTITYYDGLGRPVQTLSNKQSPTRKDVVQIMEYDEFGRQVKQYLPYTVASSGLDFRSGTIAEQKSFYEQQARVAHTNYPFEEIIYDNSPLNKVVEQSSAGVDWQLDNGHTTTTKYTSSLAADKVYIWNITSSMIQTSGYYAGGTLYKNEMTDANGAKTIEFVNKKGNVILKRQQVNNASPAVFTNTYYVFNEFNELSVVIPPQYFDEINTGESVISFDPTTNERVYLYKYDDRKRLVEKKVPHKGWEYIVYDNLDRPILTQDANLRLENKWYFTKYDIIGRPVLEGLWTDRGICEGGVICSRANLQAKAVLDDDIYDVRAFSQHFDPYILYGYRIQSFPAYPDFMDFLKVYYYDDYDFNYDGSADHKFIQHSTFTAVNTSRTRGLATGNMTKVLGSALWLTSVNFYDEKGRIIQNRSNNYLGGEDIVHTSYDFIDQVTRTLLEHTNNSSGGGYIQLGKRFTYDHAGRPLRTYHRINNEPEIILSENKYNELGQLIDKKIHSTNLTTPKYLQSIDYAYNIRGWLTHINNDDLNDDEYNSSTIPDGIVVGYSMNSLNYTVQEIPSSGGDGEVPHLVLMINDESEIMVEGEVNTELYQNGESKIIKLMDAPAEGEDPLYNTLLQLSGNTIVQSFEPSYVINSETTIEDLYGWIYPGVQAALAEYEFTDPAALDVMQQAVFNYVAGKAGQIMDPEESGVFATPDITVYFYEENGYNLYMTISDVHSNLSFSPFIMARTSANQAEYNHLYDLTNPLSDPGDPSSPRVAQPIEINFAAADLYEGMSTVEAIQNCQELATSILQDLTITNQKVKGLVNGFARGYALQMYGNQFFNDDANDLWGMEIKYNYPTVHNGANAFGIPALYNGNISETTWKSKGDLVKRGYGYQYDKLNRITSATYKAFNVTGDAWNAEVGRYSVPQLGYDLNGNILNLKRNGYTAGTMASPTWGVMDNLTYSYNYGDQLMSVSDNGNIHHINDFKDGNTSGNDYIYDLNGNLTADLNKGIQNITYSHLNLPEQIEFDGIGNIIYVYSADGIKLQKVVDNKGTITTTDYTAIGNYVNGNLDFITTDEGRVVKDGVAWRYEYYYKDHLGNTRLGFSDYDGDQEVDMKEITQQSNYYPFGLEHKGTNYFAPGTATQTTHKYLFNGKELQDEMGLDWYDFSARNYSADVGRWFNVDPWASKYPHITPYNFVENNPINLVDPTGLGPWKPDGEGGWIAEKGDGAETLAEDAWISRERAYELLDQQGYGTYVDPEDGVTKSAVDPGDVVVVPEQQEAAAKERAEIDQLQNEISENKSTITDLRNKEAFLFNKIQRLKKYNKISQETGLGKAHPGDPGGEWLQIGEAIKIEFRNREIRKINAERKVLKQSIDSLMDKLKKQMTIRRRYYIPDIQEPDVIPLKP